MCNTSFLINCRQGDFIVLYVWEILVRKNVTIFEGCRFSRFSIFIWLSFRKIETKNFNSDPSFFNSFKIGTISFSAHFLNCVHIGKNQTIAATILGLSSGKRFVKSTEGFLRFLNHGYGKKLYIDTLKSRYWSLFVLLFLLSYTCIL